MRGLGGDRASTVLGTELAEMMVEVAIVERQMLQARVPQTARQRDAHEITQRQPHHVAEMREHLGSAHLPPSCRLLRAKIAKPTTHTGAASAIK